MPERNYHESQAERRARQRQEERAEEDFAKHRSAGTSYGAQLRALAKQVARIIEAHGPYPKDEPIPSATLARIREAMAAYSTAITPWARSTTWRMITEVNRRNKTAWDKYTQGMGIELRRELQTAPIGTEVDKLLAEQVKLITSLPLDAAQRIHVKTIEAITLGLRYDEHEAEIEEALAAAHPDATEAWLVNRAKLIARTETARTASVLTQARAEHVNSESYIWRTAKDWKVRPSHKAMEGLSVRWDNPPVLDNLRGHAGQLPNCRCVALPIIPGV